ncbi:MAG: hypothetical protein ROZ64_05365 [Burkholderiaceae bacterium]|jgi:hypothetical protein|nr:hypothetical protein [Burkholderiaceae bacterium]
MNGMKISVSALFAAVALAAGGAAQAAACSVSGSLTGADLGTMSTADATLSLNGGAATASDACNLSDQGSGGNTSGTLLGGYYSPTYGSGDFTQVSNGVVINGITFTSITFDSAAGTWAFTWSGGPASLDLALAIHASDRTGSFLFNDRTLVADASGNGTWVINWLNNGGQVPGFSNFGFWARTGSGDVPGPNPTPVPGTALLLGLGLAGLGLRARMRRS